MVNLLQARGLHNIVISDQCWCLIVNNHDQFQHTYIHTLAVCVCLSLIEDSATDSTFEYFTYNRNFYIIYNISMERIVVTEYQFMTIFAT